MSTLRRPRPERVPARTVGRRAPAAPGAASSRSLRSRSSPCRSSGCSGGRRGATPGRSLTSDSCVARRCGCRSCCSLWATALVAPVRRAARLAAGPRRVPGARASCRALCTLSMVLPPVVGGVALFFALGRRGLVGQYLDRWFGITLPFTTAGVIVAQTFVAMPFLVLTVEAALRQLDRRYEDAAPHARRVPLVRVPAGDAAGDPAGAHRRRRARRGRARSASSARRSRSPATSPAGRRRCRSPSTSPLRVEPGRGDRPQPGAHRRVVRRAGRPSRPLARWRRTRAA